MSGMPRLRRQRVALVNGRVVLPAEVVERTVLIDDGRIAGIVDSGALPPGTERIDVGGRLVAPGLIDIHTHGALGHTFNEPSAEAYSVITRENASHGVTSLLATLVTAPIADLVACLQFARHWIGEAHEGAQVLGVHLEGPYLSVAQKGAQDPAHIRTPDDGTADLLLAQADVLRIVTLAPELPGALELTQRITRLGIVPAAGHSSAREDEVQAAMRRGLRHAVHLWSGQSSTVREGPWRKPGLLEMALTCDGLTAEMIADNRHLPPTLMRMAYRCKGAGRLCVVSDATSGAGLPEGSRFQMGGMEYDVRDGVGMLLDRTAFAGSTTLLDGMVRVLTQVVGVPLVEALRMASLTPARIIGVEGRKGSLAAGKDADIAIFGDDLTVWRTMVAGRWVYPEPGG